MIKQIFKYCLLLLCAAAATGCIKENTGDCFASVRLRFNYTLHNEQGNLFGRDVHHIRAYVFDEGGVLDTIVSAQGSLSNDYVMDLALEPGRYTIVAWGAGGETFAHYRQLQSEPAKPVSGYGELMPGVTTLEQLRVALACGDTADAEGDLHPAQAQFDDLFYGISGTRSTDGRSCYTVIPVDLQAGQVEDRTIELIRNTNVVRLTVTGLTGLTPKTNFDAWITGTNGCYTYGNAMDAAAPRIHYESRFAITNDVGAIQADISIQRLEWSRTTGDPVTLCVKDLQQNKMLAQLDLVDLLRKVKNDAGTALYRNQEDFDREYEYSITLAFDDDDNDNLTLKVYVNNWLVQDIKPEL